MIERTRTRAAAAPHLKTIILTLAWALCAAYGAIHLDHRWIPHDEGTLAHAAERVTHGQLPHADFDDVYTGGGTFLNAAVFELLGPRLINLRLMLYVAFLVWVATLLYIGSRFLSPWAAGLTAIAAVLWGMPNYAAALPSWYNLFFATFGTAALLREAETGKRGWLWLAGAFAGVSITFKIVGLYFVAATFLYFVYREVGAAHAASRRETREGAGADAPVPGASDRFYSMFVSAGVFLFVLAVARLVRSEGLLGVVEYVIPVAALAAVILAAEWRAPAGGFGTRLRRLLGWALPFGGGAALPIALFALPYVLDGSLDALLHGVFVLPIRRMGFATVSPPGGVRPIALLVLAIVIALPMLSGWIRRGMALLLAAIALAVLALSGQDPVYAAIFKSLIQLVPLAMIAAVVPLWRWDRSDAAPPRTRRDGLFLLLAVTATWSLVRYPFAGVLYYFYVVPLLFLTLAALSGDLRPARRHTIAGAIGFYALFAMLWIGTNSLLGILFRDQRPAVDDFIPPVQRAGLRMTRFEAAQYELLVRAVEVRARGPYLYATPDAPEVYFLTGMLNPTRTLFDFFDEPAGRTQRVMDALREADVNVVVLKRQIPFSGPVPADLGRALAERYPSSEVLGLYELRWRP